MILSRCYYKSSNSSTNFQWVIESKLCQVIKLIRKFSFLKRIDHFVIINFFLQRAKYDFCLFDRHCSLSDILQSLIFYLSIFLFVSFNTFISACISYLLLLQIIQLTFCVCVFFLLQNKFINVLIYLVLRLSVFLPAALALLLSAATLSVPYLSSITLHLIKILDRFYVPQKLDQVLVKLRWFLRIFRSNFVFCGITTWQIF